MRRGRQSAAISALASAAAGMAAIPDIASAARDGSCGDLGRVAVTGTSWPAGLRGGTDAARATIVR